MKKAALIAFILVDLGLIGASVFVLVTFIRRHGSTTALMPKNSVSPVASVTSGPVPSTATISAVTPPLRNPADTAGGTTRKIRFSYHNAKAKHVMIRADFTGWKADPMIRSSNGEWSYTVPLSPGEYAYCFSIDDKPPLKDPANKRTKLIGRAVVSAIVVQALPTKPSP